ncbi:MAG: macro domain-containing protein, partial [Cetobacterium sp.]|uniref:macro domain-containing protein n=1 Tax=Cetobacterium sp. TaxID=2071632 RepID=UPI003EE6FB7C
IRSTTMLEKKGNILEMDCDALCITTNGFIKRSTGAAVMGAGIAKQIKTIIPSIDYLLGGMIKRSGNNVHPLVIHNGVCVVSFPVKPITETSDGTNYVSHKYFPIGSTIPGWACKAKLELIERSARQLVKLADEYGWQTVLIPRAGCGAGELNWKDVKPILDNILDDRFIACTF